MALSTVVAVPGGQAIAAPRPHGKVWTPGSPLGNGMKPVKGKNLTPARPSAPAYPVPAEWKPAAGAAATGTATVDLGDGRTKQAGKLPVKVAPGQRDGAKSVKVEVTGADKGRAAGASGPVVALTDPAAGAGSGGRSVKVALDLKALQAAGWADRAQLVALPGCALTTPELAECRTRTPIAASVDPASAVLTAEVTLPGAAPARTEKSSAGDGGRVVQAAFVESSPTAGASAVLAADPAPSGPGGSYTASPLSASAAWSSGTNTGSFGYSYPVQLPASLGGSAPSVSLSYDSSRVDGKTSASNAQASWVGEGWDYQPGFIERSYQDCGRAGITGSGDKCWAGWNATLNLEGHSGALVRDDATGQYRIQGDDGSKVERLTGAANEAKGGEHWRVTTSDGTQYWFGVNHLPGGGKSDPAANSVAYLPVYSPKSGDDCYDAAKGNASWCQEGWRWSLDYVVDSHQNLTGYRYQQDVNNYKRGGATLTPYVRAGEVTEIDYGQRLPDQIAANGSAKAAAKVLFTTAERCNPSGQVTCTSAQRTTANQANWPDSPLDQACASSGTCANVAPTFWSPLRLWKIETQVLVGSAYRSVDSWELKHSFPDPGDGTKPALWLSSVQRTGSNGQTPISLPAVSFTARELANRVDGLVPAQPAFNRPRIQQITTETGSRINVAFRDTECSRVNNHMPASEDANSMACMPVKWYLPGQSSTDPVGDWFHKYLVRSVTEQDTLVGSVGHITEYSYDGGAAWHRDDSDVTDPKQRTWDDFRGYQTVTVTTGSGNAGEAPKTQQVTTFLRGMNGDRLANGSTRSVSVSLTPYPGAAAVSRTDEAWLAGRKLGSQVFDKAGGAVVSATATQYGGEATTATRKQTGGMPDLVARYASTGVTATGYAELADGSWRTTTTVSTTDPAKGNRLVTVDDKGDGTAATPEICTTTDYATGPDPQVTALIAQKRAVVGACGTSPNAGNTVSDSRSRYDGKPFGQAGSVGDQTSAEVLDSYDGNGQAQYATQSTSTFDVYGRGLTAAGPDGATVTTGYTPAAGALPTLVTTGSPMGAGWNTTQTLDPGRARPLVATDANGRVSTQQFDALGRLTAAWAADRPTTESPSRKVSYGVDGLNAPSVLTTETLLEDGSYARKTDLLDSLGRPRQTQSSPSTGEAGRLITDTVYDSHGWAVKSSQPYYEQSQPNTTVYLPQDSQVPGQTWTTYDGRGRKVTESFRSYAQEQWVTTTAYPGADRTDVTPPKGATATSTVTDARGRTVELWQYRTAGATGNAADADITRYGFTPGGQPKSRTDAAGNTWSHGYDLRGRRTTVTDPDSGTTVTGYDVNSRVATTRDARGETIAYTYDLLGRKTGEYGGSVAPANQLTGWTYDTLAKGQLTSSTRYVGGASGTAYTKAVTGYDTMYRQLGTSVTVPSTEGVLAGTYTTANQYSPILGSLIHTDLPAVGGLAAEGVDMLYSSTGLLIASGGSSTLVTDVQYDALGRATRTTVGDWGNQVVSERQYDWATGRIVRTALSRQTGTTATDDTRYTYDPAGRITSISDQQNGTATDTQCFVTDHLGRLTRAWTDTAGTATQPAPSVPAIGACVNAGGPVGGSVGGPAAYSQGYEYDATGNRTKLVRYGVGAATGQDTTTVQTFGSTGNRPHALTGTTTTGPGGATSATYGYDVAGNTVDATESGVATAYTWDGEGKLATLTKAGKKTSYLYDADGKQLIRRNPGTTTLDLGGDQLTLDTATGKVTDVRTYAGAGGLTVTRVTAPAGGKLVHQFADHHETNGVQIDTDAAQTVTRRPSDPFGVARGTQPGTGVWAGAKGFVGGTGDDATGLTTLGAREYDSAHGRFISPDPLLLADNPQQWNAYAYSNNNPVNTADPTGLALEECASGMYTCSHGGTKVEGLGPHYDEIVAEEAAFVAYQAAERAKEEQREARKQAAAERRRLLALQLEDESKQKTRWPYHRTGREMEPGDRILPVSFNAAETQMCKESPADCVTYGKIAAWSMERTQDRYGSNHGERANAYRHTIWQAALTYELGEDKAEQWADAHEAYHSQSQQLDHLSDLVNNVEGRKIGNSVKSPSHPGGDSAVIGGFIETDVAREIMRTAQAYVASDTYARESDFQPADSWH